MRILLRRRRRTPPRQDPHRTPQTRTHPTPGGIVTDQWPWPDDRLERRSRVARMYRDRLADLDAAACAELDEVMAAYGQTWIIDGPYVPPETLMTEAQVADWADVSRRTVQKW